MTIHAKYAGTCRKCGRPINVGDEIDWERGRGAAHVECPVALEPEPDNGIRVSKGEGYGGRPYRVGEVIRQKNQILVVVVASQTYYREDGMSFGVGDDSGYIYSAVCRLATDEEATPLLGQEQAAAAKRAAQATIAEIAARIQQEGELPEKQDSAPDGVRILDTQNIYGGGDWFVISDEHIWYVRNNGMDGDNWARNNVRTGGAGGIGWRITRDQAVVDALMAAESLLMPEAQAERDAEAREEEQAQEQEPEPDWVNQDRPARIYNTEDRIFTPAVHINTSHCKGMRPEYLATMAVELDRYVVHDYDRYPNTWQLWDDGKLSAFRVVSTHASGELPSRPSIYPDDVSEIIGIALRCTMKRVKDDLAYREWLLSMQHIDNGETELRDVLKRVIAKVDDGEPEWVTIAAQVEVPVSGDPIEVIFERDQRNCGARIVRTRVTFADGHTENIYINQHEWACMGPEDGDAGTEYEFGTDRTAAVAAARKWLEN